MAIYKPKSSYKVFKVDSDTGPIVFKDSGLEFAGDTYHQDPDTKEYFAGLPGERNGLKDVLIVGDTTVEKGSPDQLYVAKNMYDLLRKDESGYRIRATVEIPTKTEGPTEVEYSRGIYTRYFSEHKQTGTILEISNSTFRDLAAKSSKYHYPSYLLGSTLWILRGPVADQEINGYIVIGAKYKNELLTAQLEESLPNIRTYLTDPTQFVK